MRRIFIFVIPFIIFFIENSAFADYKSVTIKWEVNGSTIDVQGYKMIYSYKSDMSNPMVACNTNINTAKSLTCENVKITSTEVFFRIIAEIDQKNIVNSNIQHVSVPVSQFPVAINVIKTLLLKPK